MGHYLAFEHPWVLLTLPAAWAICFWAARRGMGKTPLVLHLLLITLLILAVSMPLLRLGDAGSTTVLAVDVSGSMRGARESPTEVIGKVRESLAKSPGAILAVVAFGRDARVVMRPHPADDEAFDRLSLPDIRDDATDIAAGIAMARAIVSTPAQVILWIDGLQTTGTAADEAHLAAKQGIAIHILPPSKTTLPDARVATVEMPSQLLREQAVPVQIGLSSNVSRPAELTLSRRGPRDMQTLIARQRVDLVAGRTLYTSFSDKPPAPGIFTYTAQVKLSGDAVPENDSASKAVEIEGGWSALYLFGKGERPGRLVDLLKADELLDLKVLAAGTAAMDEIAHSQLVILHNLSGDDLAPDDWHRLLTFVKDMGGAILVLGGDRSFGLGQYDKMPLAPALPVTSAPEKRHAVTLVIVLDVSGSMGQAAGGTTKLAVAKQAVLGLQKALSDDDRVGIVAFSEAPTVLAAPTSANQWEELRQKLLRLQAGGGTRITPALEAAETMLRIADAQGVKHILLLSDGESEDFEAQRLAKQFADQNISVSTVATGEQANREKLELLARRTGGRFYEMEDIQALPATFLKDLLEARQKIVSRKTQAVVWKDPRPIWPDEVPDVPAVAYHLVTQAKKDARVHLATTDGHPIAASWRFGLGKVAVLPVSLESPENPPWSDWADLPSLVWPMVDWLRARPQPADWALNVAEQDGELHIEVRGPAIEAAGKPNGFEASILGPSGRLQRTRLEQTAPGVFTASIKATEQGTYWVSVAQAGLSEEATAWQREAVTLGPAPEWLRMDADEDLLHRLAQITGGKVIKDFGQIAELAQERQGKLYPVGIYLVYAAAVVFLAEILLHLLKKD